MYKKNLQKNVLIFGAGSIGNHMAFASRKLGLNVDITDVSIIALKRMRSQIFVSRYGKWDYNINLIPIKDVFKNKKEYNLVIVGTPPNTHYQIYKKVLKKLKFKNILIEKPLTNYLSKYYKNFDSQKYRIFCGYNHSLSLAFKYYLKAVKKNQKKINKIHVEWKEGWSGILKAHPWLKNEFGSYLGNIKKGGGALQEHSHGLHLLLLLIKQLKIKFNKKNINFFSIKKNKKKIEYDCYSNLTFISKKIFVKYETDLISKNPLKKIVVETDNQEFTIMFNYQTNIDAVIIYKNKRVFIKKLFKKNRSTEFEREINHILKINKQEYLSSPINVKNGIDVIEIIRKILK